MNECHREWYDKIYPERDFRFWGALMMQSDQNHHHNLLPLFGLAIIILLVFAWTYFR
jgi:hypothetical protein